MFLKDYHRIRGVPRQRNVGYRRGLYLRKYLCKHGCLGGIHLQFLEESAQHRGNSHHSGSQATSLGGARRSSDREKEVGGKVFDSSPDHGVSLSVCLSVGQCVLFFKYQISVRIYYSSKFFI